MVPASRLYGLLWRHICTTPAGSYQSPELTTATRSGKHPDDNSLLLFWLAPHSDARSDLIRFSTLTKLPSNLEGLPQTGKVCSSFRVSHTCSRRPPGRFVIPRVSVDLKNGVHPDDPAFYYQWIAIRQTADARKLTLEPVDAFDPELAWLATSDSLLPPGPRRLASRTPSSGSAREKNTALANTITKQKSPAKPPRADPTPHQHGVSVCCGKERASQSLIPEAFDPTRRASDASNITRVDGDVGNLHPTMPTFPARAVSNPSKIVDIPLDSSCPQAFHSSLCPRDCIPAGRRPLVDRGGCISPPLSPSAPGRDARGPIVGDVPWWDLPVDKLPSRFYRLTVRKDADLSRVDLGCRNRLHAVLREARRHPAKIALMADWIHHHQAAIDVPEHEVLQTLLQTICEGKSGDELDVAFAKLAYWVNWELDRAIAASQQPLSMATAAPFWRNPLTGNHPEKAYVSGNEPSASNTKTLTRAASSTTSLVDAALGLKVKSDIGQTSDMNEGTSRYYKRRHGGDGAPPADDGANRYKPKRRRPTQDA